MSPFKWLSVGVGVTSFVLVAVMMTWVFGPAWTLAGGSFTDALVAAAAVGLLSAALIWLVGGAHAAALRRAIAMAQALASDQGADLEADWRAGFGLDRLIDPIRQLRAQLGGRADQAERRCRQLEADLAAIRGESFAGVSHELRTPLSSIKGCLEMLMDGEAADLATRSDFYNIILAETNRLSHLVDSVLSISRAQSATARPSTVSDLDELVREAVDVAMPQARARRLTLSCDAEVAAPVPMDADLVRQVMHHLLSNAIKYTEPGGRVDVSLSLDVAAGRALVSVADTGVGICAQALPRVFDKFFRVADHAAMAKGAGLGLNLVRHAIETVHGGTIDVKSEIGCGSTFTFALPIAENHIRVPAAGTA